ncbi:MAG TPA: amino acid adenylation domain-containing protein, partial [Thermoanaerobaculia bacterium]|nr:amino acid adenylation domain-containing protein [Thermoanaerobaculia bacterium]
ELGVGPDVIVGVHMERSVELMVALLAVLKAGGAYLPLDPDHPPDRLRFMVQDSGAALVLAQRALAARLGELLPRPQASAPPILWLDDMAMAAAAPGCSVPEAAAERRGARSGASGASRAGAGGAAGPDGLAYVIYTSGSTGRPKGTMNTHRGIVNRLLWMQQRFGLTGDDRVLQKTPFGFDVSVWELFWPLLAGARLVMARPGGHRDPRYLLQTLAEQEITTLHFVPAMLRAFLAGAATEGGGGRLCLPRLRRVMASGEALAADLQEQYYAALAAPLYNLYGPTEAAVDVTCWACDPAPAPAVPIGRPVANTRIHLLDRDGQEVPIGVPGELHIGGVQVSRGYLGRPDLTAGRFVPDPFAGGEPGARLYRTGDLARYLPGGAVDFLGRIDHQVKIRGFRIELGEIEAALVRHPAVAAAAVVAHGPAADGGRLVAYVAPDARRATPLLHRERLAREGLLAERALYELPNGMEVAHQNRAETDFLYQEIFVEEAYLQHGITLAEGDCIFDVGANIGMFSLFAGRLLAGVRIFAFEPMPEVFASLRLNTALYGLDARLFDCALADAPGTAELTFYPNATLMSGRYAAPAEEREMVRGVLRRQAAEATDDQLDEVLRERLGTHRVTARLRTLSEVIAEHGVERIDLLKVDVEKAEWEVLAGLGEGDWPRVRQVVVEVHDTGGRLEAVTGLLRRHGFAVAARQDTTLSGTPLWNVYARRPLPAPLALAPTASTAPTAPAAPVTARPRPAAERVWSSRPRLAAELRRGLEDSLPEPMLPAAFVILPALPLSANGKLDRKALPAPEEVAWEPASEDVLAPRTPVEEGIAEIWREVLSAAGAPAALRIGAHDHFFHLGGHSLLGGRVMSRLRQVFGVDLALRALFDAPTLAALALRVEAALQAGAGAPATPISRVPRDGLLPLSLAQQRLWFLDRLAPGSPTYNIPTAFELRGPLSPAALAASLSAVVRRHETLRTRFVAVDGEPWQDVAAPAPLALPLVDLGALPPPPRHASHPAELLRLAQEEALLAFDLARGPLLRARLVRLGPARHVLLLTVHHIVYDGWSEGILLEELSALYEAAVSGRPSPLPGLPVQYADFAAWQRTWPPEALAQQLAWWRRQLAGAPLALELPTDLPRPAVQSSRGHGRSLRLMPDEAARLRLAARREGATLFMLLLAGFSTLLARLSGQDDLLVGAAVANRTRPEIEGLIGFFVNTLALRARVDGEMDFRRALAAARETALQAFAHQDLPFDALVEELRPQRDLGRNPLVQAVMVLQSAGSAAATVGSAATAAANAALSEAGRALRPVPLRLGERTTSKCDILLSVEEETASEPGLLIELECASDLFTAPTVTRLLAQYAALLLGAAAAPELPLARLPLLSAAERHQALWEHNDTAAAVPARTLHRLFQEQAAARPEAVAVRWEDGELTYGELDRRARHVARALRRLGVGREARVGLCVERSGDMVAAVLGILMAGGAYLPLDPAYPRERLQWLLDDAAPLAIVGTRRLLAALPGATPRLAFEDLAAATAPADGQDPADPAVADGTGGGGQEPTPDWLAYVLYTSGSTGTPKGVEVSHRAVVRLVRGANYATLGRDEVFLQLAPMGFDAATLELWGPLLNGGRLALFPPRPFSLPELYRTVERHGVTTLWLTAGLFHLAVEEGIQGLAGLRQLLAGGDALSPRHVRQALAALPGVELINGYGPTENTTFSCCCRVRGALARDREPAASREPNAVPIGRPISGSLAYVLDRELQPVPLGCAGELYVGGAGLARGYLRRPELTAEAFVPDPFAGGALSQGGRLYRTGDLARRQADGTLVFAGRRDHQVKVRGFRIEPGEIESVLRRHPGVGEAVVAPFAEGGRDRRLAAFYTAADESLDEAALRAFARRSLPEHMVPSAFLRLPALPLTANGKVDRRALPSPADLLAAADPGERDAAVPRTPVEEVIAGIWEEVLGFDRARPPRGIGLHENFFDLGGHSLLVTRVLSRIREALGVELKVQALFAHPTVAALAQAVTEARLQAVEIALPPLARVARGGRLPLSFPQQRLWFLDRLAPDSSTYNVPAAYELRGPLDRGALAAALDQVVGRHEALRTRIVEIDGEPWQEIAPPYPFSLPLLDLTGLGAGLGAGLADAPGRRELARLGGAEAARPFDLARGSLLRALLVRLAGETHVLLLTVHHIVSDGWSQGLLLAELAALYGAAASRRPAPLGPLPIQYADFAAWQRGWPREVLERQLAYWRQRLAGLSTLEVPTDRPRPPVQTFRGGLEPVTVPPDLTAELRSLARHRRVTLFMCVLAAWQALFHRLTGQADVAVGSPVANRTHPEIEGLIGFFVNLLALRADCGGDPAYLDLLDRVRTLALEAYDHADLPFERLVDELSLGRDLSRQPLVQVMFQLESAAPPPELPGLDLAPLDLSGAVAKFDLTLSLLDSGETLAGTVEYSTDLFDRTTVARLAGQLLQLLAAAAAAPAARLAGLELLTAAERHQLLREWNDTAAVFPGATLLHQFFAAAAARSPAAIAAVCAGQELTYQDLAARASRLANLLRDEQAAGLGRGAAVGVWMERSLDMLVAVLGILEAGGHYLPLEAAWPAARVEAILGATGARAVVAGAALLPAVEEMRWRLPALADAFCLGIDEPAPPVEEIDPAAVRELFDLVAERAVDRETAGGFVSAFTGRPFAAAEVDAYRDHVLALAAPWLRRDAAVLEIGCGSGLLLWEMAPRVGRAVGIDPSPLTQERNRERLAGETRERAAAGLPALPPVELRTGFAHQLDDLLAPGERFDLVLLASTVQFFPGPRYFEQVAAAAFARLAPGGALLVADVLDASRRDELAQAIAAAGQPAEAGRRRELYLHADHFRDLGASLPGAGEIAVRERPDGFAHELGYRYDVLLCRLEPAEPAPEPAEPAPEPAEPAPEPAAPAPAAPRRRKRVWTAWHAARQPAVRPPAVASPDDVAYVIHTSGSTGEPKGIVVQHRPVANLIAWINRTFGVGAADRGLFVTSLSFDLSVYDVFGVLAAGGTIHVATAEELDDPHRLVRLLRTGGITLWDSAPAALVRLAPLFPERPDHASRLRLVLLSGDWIPVTLPDRVRRAFPAARVMALGGATEATVWSNWFPVGEVGAGWPSIPYGRPIANARYHALDAGLEPCPVGVPGDLHIGGGCLCAGYARRPELTAASFVPDPFAAAPGGRLYRTGDRVRHLADGNLEFLGRRDQQVKVRGYRIELGEIDAVLARHPGVREAVTLARPARSGAPADLQLAAYVVARQPDAAPPAAELRELLRRSLPDYMVPAAFVFLAALPVTANGKLDRQALPDPAAAEGADAAGKAGAARPAAPPKNPLEERLAQLWREVLDLPAVGVHDSFFELGGHSLLATQLVARIRQTLGVELPLRLLFQRPSIAELAVEIAGIVQSGRSGENGAAPVAGATSGAPVAAALSPIRPVPRDGDLVLSSSQLRQWFLVQLEPQSTAYNLPLTLELRGALRPEILAGCLDEMVRRHESLRTTFAVAAGRPVPVVADRLALPLPLVDLRGLPGASRRTESRRLAQHAGEQVFDLTRGPLLDTRLVRLQADEHYLLVTLHHIVFDGWSLGVFTRELAALYAAFREGRPSPLPALAIQYLDYAAWQRQWLLGEEARRQGEYWRGRLAGA